MSFVIRRMGSMLVGIAGAGLLAGCANEAFTAPGGAGGSGGEGGAGGATSGVVASSSSAASTSTTAAATSSTSTGAAATSFTVVAVDQHDAAMANVPVVAHDDHGVPGNAAHTNVSGTPHTIHWIMQHLDLAGEPLSQTALMQLAHEAMPNKHRELTAAEVCQEHDLIFTLSPGDRLPLMWQPAHARMWHSPGSRHFIFCRHVDAPVKLESPEIRLLNHGERISTIEKILTGITSQLEKLSQGVSYLTELEQSREARSKPATSPHS